MQRFEQDLEKYLPWLHNKLSQILLKNWKMLCINTDKDVGLTEAMYRFWHSHSCSSFQPDHKDINELWKCESRNIMTDIMRLTNRKNHKYASLSNVSQAVALLSEFSQLHMRSLLPVPSNARVLITACTLIAAGIRPQRWDEVERAQIEWLVRQYPIFRREYSGMWMQTIFTITAWLGKRTDGLLVDASMRLHNSISHAQHSQGLPSGSKRAFENQKKPNWIRSGQYSKLEDIRGIVLPRDVKRKRDNGTIPERREQLGAHYYTLCDEDRLRRSSGLFDELHRSQQKLKIELQNAESPFVDHPHYEASANPATDDDHLTAEIVSNLENIDSNQVNSNSNASSSSCSTVEISESEGSVEIVSAAEIQTQSEDSSDDDLRPRVVTTNAESSFANEDDPNISSPLSKDTKTGIEDLRAQGYIKIGEHRSIKVADDSDEDDRGEDGREEDDEDRNDSGEDGSGEDNNVKDEEVEHIDVRSGYAGNENYDDQKRASINAHSMADDDKSAKQVNEYENSGLIFNLIKNSETENKFPEDQKLALGRNEALSIENKSEEVVLVSRKPIANVQDVTESEKRESSIRTPRMTSMLPRFPSTNNKSRKGMKENAKESNESMQDVRAKLKEAAASALQNVSAFLKDTEFREFENSLQAARKVTEAAISLDKERHYSEELIKAFQASRFPMSDVANEYEILLRKALSIAHNWLESVYEFEQATAGLYLPATKSLSLVATASRRVSIVAPTPRKKALMNKLGKVPDEKNEIQNATLKSARALRAQRRSKI